MPESFVNFSDFFLPFLELKSIDRGGCGDGMVSWREYQSKDSRRGVAQHVRKNQEQNSISTPKSLLLPTLSLGILLYQAPMNVGKCLFKLK